MEIVIVHFFQQLGNGTAFDLVMKIISSKIFLAVFRCICIGLTIRKNKQQRKSVLLSFIISLALFFLISELFFKHFLVDFTGLRIRPYLAYPDIITAIGTSYSDSSFPSSHMTSTVAILTVMVLFRKKTWIFAIVFALAMGISRMHNGMHYPSDVLAGIILGLICGLGSVKIAKHKIMSGF